MLTRLMRAKEGLQPKSKGAESAEVSGLQGRKASCRQQTTRVLIPTRAGTFTGWFSNRGLARLSFPRPGRSPGGSENSASSHALDRELHGWVEQTRQAIEAIFAGRVPRELPPLDWRGATDFQKQVWKQLLAIPPGQTRTYGEVATAVGRTGAARAVGRACGANPIPVLVPCHRVLSAGGKLGGFSAGLNWKKRLLAAEHAARRSALGGTSRG